MPTVSLPAHRRDQAASEFLLADHGVAMQSAVAGDQRVHVRIVQRADHDLHGMALQRVKERANLPASEVSGQQQDAFAALLRRLKILEALIDSDLRSVAEGVAGEEAELAQQAPERHVDAAQNPAALVSRFFRESHPQVAQADAAQTRVHPVHQLANQDADPTGQRPRQGADQTHEQCNRPILQPVAHQGYRF